MVAGKREYLTEQKRTSATPGSANKWRSAEKRWQPLDLTDARGREAHAWSKDEKALTR